MCLHGTRGSCGSDLSSRCRLLLGQADLFQRCPECPSTCCVRVLTDGAEESKEEPPAVFTPRSSSGCANTQEGICRTPASSQAVSSLSLNWADFFDELFNKELGKIKGTHG